MMTLLKLIPTPYLVLGIAVILGVTHGVTAYGGYKWRDNAARAEAQKAAETKIKELTVLNNEIIRLQREARAAEAEHAAKLVSVSTTLQERLKNVRDEKDKFVSDVRSGAIRLRIPTAVGSVPGGTAKTTAGTSGCDAAAGSDLPAPTVEFLWGEASRADEVVEQLTACQQTVTEYYRLCGSGK